MGVRVFVGFAYVAGGAGGWAAELCWCCATCCRLVLPLLGGCVRDSSGNPFASRGCECVCVFIARVLFLVWGKRLLLRNEVALARHSPRKRVLCPRLLATLERIARPCGGRRMAGVVKVYIISPMASIFLTCPPQGHANFLILTVRLTSRRNPRPRPKTCRQFSSLCLK
jgi:hypothetical protein